MARFPDLTQKLDAISGAIYSGLADRVRNQPGERFPLHVGDTWLEPAEGCRMEDLCVTEYPGMHRYASPRGMPELLSAVAERAERRMGVTTASEEVLVAAGATGALGAVLGAIVDPGDEILILAPYWPLISGIAHCFGGVPVPVPVLGEVDSAETLVEAVSRRKTARTVAVYLSTPNNPTGRVMPAEQVEALASWAASEELWILADEVYEDYLYQGEHRYARSVAPERTFSTHSFSKAFGMAGNRCGYVIGPAAVMGQLGKVSTHTFYSTPTASQIAALRALDSRGDGWIAEVRPQYMEAGRRAAERLGVAAPEGSTFLFLDMTEQLDENGLGGLLADCADRGLLLAPGPSFGPYPNHVRLCFTSAPPDAVARGVEVLAERMGR